jgi:integrase
MNYKAVPAFVKRLRDRPGTAARALEFALLTVARTSEVLELTPGEIDEAACIWRVPAERMKGGEEHVVHLSPRALEIFADVQGLCGTYVFASPRARDKTLSNMAMLQLLRSMGVAKETTVHGLCRASFSTWAYETGAARPDVIEACLAHREADRVKAAYNRAAFAAERRALLNVWAEFIDGTINEDKNDRNNAT